MSDEARSIWRWRQVGALDVSMAILLMLGVVLAWGLPDDLYDRSPVARGFADAVASVVRGIDELASISSFPGVTRIVLATLWSCVPIVAAYIAFAPGVLQLDARQLRALPRLVRWAIVGVFIAVSVVGPILISFDPDALDGDTYFDHVIQFASQHRLGLGFIAGSYCAVSALFLALLPTYLNGRKCN